MQRARRSMSAFLPTGEVRVHEPRVLPDVQDVRHELPDALHQLQQAVGLPPQKLQRLASASIAVLTPHNERTPTVQFTQQNSRQRPGSAPHPIPHPGSTAHRSVALALEANARRVHSGMGGLAFRTNGGRGRVVRKCQLPR